MSLRRFGSTATLPAMDILSRLRAKSTPVVVNLTPDLLEAVDALVKASGANRQQVVLELVRDGLRAGVPMVSINASQIATKPTKPHGRTHTAAQKQAISRKLKAFWVKKRAEQAKAKAEKKK